MLVTNNNTRSQAFRVKGGTVTIPAGASVEIDAETLRGPMTEADLQFWMARGVVVAKAEKAAGGKAKAEKAKDGEPDGNSDGGAA
jgi:hypothetical protein